MRKRHRSTKRKTAAFARKRAGSRRQLARPISACPGAGSRERRSRFEVVMSQRPRLGCTAPREPGACPGQAANSRSDCVSATAPTRAQRPRRPSASAQQPAAKVAAGQNSGACCREGHRRRLPCEPSGARWMATAPPRPSTGSQRRGWCRAETAATRTPRRVTWASAGYGEHFPLKELVPNRLLPLPAEKLDSRHS